MHLLLRPTPDPLHIIMPMVRSLLLRLERRLVCATIFAFFLHTCEWVGDQQRRRECDYVDRIRVCRFRERVVRIVYQREYKLDCDGDCGCGCRGN